MNRTDEEKLVIVKTVVSDLFLPNSILTKENSNSENNWLLSFKNQLISDHFISYIFFYLQTFGNQPKRKHQENVMEKQINKKSVKQTY